ncbi:MAG: glycoside hydrolase family 3 C-terminal domain-containing protein [Robiginitalea sp.]|uniref:glycoside hydrolase family 3 C-terminal domain-containing protein n=1 Tax=Robiginitalea sp. TaxID=1902411 RepID=UPI003C71CCDB
MNRTFKRILIILLAILGFLLIIALIGGFYINSAFLSFGLTQTQPDTEIDILTTGGFQFRDLNRNGVLDPYEDSRISMEERTEDLLSRLTLEEKINMLKGSGIKSLLSMEDPDLLVPGAAGTIEPVHRLGIPRVYLADGPAGLRITPVRKESDKTYYATAFPIATLLASTWNVDLVQDVGRAMGNEVLEYGLDVLLAPGANIQRNPLCGRNFEYYSEDPLLSGYIGAAMVNGIESNGVGTSVKHFVANNQESGRYGNDVIVSQRALREIYLKGFEIIVKESQPWTIMSSYNKVNGTYTSQSRRLLTDILRDEWGFEGLVVTDWFGGSDAVAQIQAGNDLLQPGTRKQWKALKEASEEGALSEGDINTSVRRILKLVLGSRKMDNYAFTNAPDLKNHARITRESASEGMVLLKNEQVLPLQGSEKIALFGVTSFEFIAGGTGSGDVNEAYTVSLQEGLKNAGLDIDQNTADAFEAHKKKNRDAFVKPEGFEAMTNPYNPPQLIPSPDLLQKAAGEADIAIVTLGRNAGEGADRVEKDDFLLSKTEKELIQNVSETFHKAGKKCLVVMNVGGVVETASWKVLPDAILLAWQGGQEGGNAVADILSGKVNPSGKLPMTFPVHLADHASSANFPMDGEPIRFTDAMFGVEEKPESEKIPNTDFTKYEEGIYVGYRHFDTQNKEVSYPFGYGLSYTDFNFSVMEVAVNDSSIDVGITVKNTGEIPGKEVIQIYSSKPDTSIERPRRELRAFGKTPLLQPGDSTRIHLSVPVSELSYWSEKKSGWELEPGTYVLEAGTSSRDIKVSLPVEVRMPQKVQ